VRRGGLEPGGLTENTQLADSTKGQKRQKGEDGRPLVQSCTEPRKPSHTVTSSIPRLARASLREFRRGRKGGHSRCRSGVGIPRSLAPQRNEAQSCAACRPSREARLWLLHHPGKVRDLHSAARPQACSRVEEEPQDCPVPRIERGMPGRHPEQWTRPSCGERPSFVSWVRGLPCDELSLGRIRHGDRKPPLGRGPARCL